MRRRTQAIVVAVSMMAAGLVQAAWTFEYTEGKQCEIGGDLRLRMTSYDRDVNPNYALPSGPDVEYLRVRERLWGCFDLAEDVQLMLRVTNRWHHYSSAPWDPNTVDSGPVATQSWSFPDEVIIDNLYLDLANIMDSNWSLRLGRQDIVLGNGMVLLEGTPFDQGRTIYYDGAVATYQTECDTLKLLGLYNRYKDTTVFINDQNRPLRYGDTAVGGAYWTHNFNDQVKTDVYYIYTEIDDDRAEANNAELGIMGFRVFGNPTSQVDYSLEVAQQRGEANGTADFTGSMIDARLNLKSAEGNALSPKLMLQYTRMSGDDPASNDEIEGWYAVHTGYPIWREELIPLLRAGQGWTNFSQYRTALGLQLAEKVKLTTAWALLVADYGEMGSNPDPHDNIGHLVSAFLDIGVMENLNVALEAAQFFPGAYFADGDTSEWLRLQTVYTF